MGANRCKSELSLLQGGKESGVKTWAQLVEGRLPGVKCNPGFFFLCSKPFSRIIFSVIFRTSNHQLVDKKN